MNKSLKKTEVLKFYQILAKMPVQEAFKLIDKINIENKLKKLN